jgi:nicotinate phosphoribosyltransferase
MFSDSLNLHKALQLKKQCDDIGFKGVSHVPSTPIPVHPDHSASFGIGTFLTNDFYTVSSGGTEKSKALNMVIKLASVDGNPCVKISDALSKVRLISICSVFRFKLFPRTPVIQQLFKRRKKSLV